MRATRATRASCCYEWLALALASLGAALFPRVASAQLRADESAPEPPAVTAEVPLTAGPGRVPVEVSLSRTPDARVGFEAAVRPTDRAARAEVSRGPVFTREPHPHHCEAPCTAHLRPGIHRVFLDAGSDFAWRVDLAVPALTDTQRLRVRLRGHLFGASFAAGPLVIVGTVATLAGPAAIIVGAATGDHTVPAELWVTGSVLFLGGAAALGLGAGLFRYARPLVESVETVETVGAPARSATADVRARPAVRTLAFSVIPAPTGLFLGARW